MRPLVAVTTTVTAEAGVYRRPEIALYAIYVDAFERADMAPVLVTPTHDRESLVSLIDHCRGLVLTGGEDVDPARYGEEPMEGLGITNPARDQAELETLRLATARRLPILAICRGCQLMNVYFGGTLYQDLTLHRPTPSPIAHRQREPWERRTHHVRIVPGSRLARIVGRDEIWINSFHHQGIKDIAPELKVVAVAEDTTVEAVESDSYPGWLLGVQWHPERHEATAPATDPDRRIIQAFGDAVREVAESP